MKFQLLLAFLIISVAQAASVIEEESGKRIVAGYDAELGQFPHMVLITNKDEIKNICGGSILNEEWIITAAGCVKDRQLDNTVVKGNLINLDGANDASVQTRQVVTVVIHPEFDTSKPTQNNIAMVKVDPKFEYGQHLTAVPLPEPGYEYTGPSYILGWGSNSSTDPTYANTLQMGHTTVHIPEDCEKEINEFCAKNNINSEHLTGDKVMCTNNEKLPWRGGACEGDEGSGLIQINEGERRDVLIGVLSHRVLDSTDDCSKGFIIYAKVSKFIDWINTVMAP